MKKKIIGIMLVAVLAMSVMFTSCKKEEGPDKTSEASESKDKGEASSDEKSGDNAEEKTAENENESSETPAENPFEIKQVFKVENKDLGEGVLFSVNGKSASAGEGRWSISKTEAQMQEQVPGMDFSMEISEGKKLYELVEDQSIDFLENLYIMQTYAEEKNMGLSQEELESIDTNIEQFDSEDGKKFLQNVGMTAEDVKNILIATSMYNLVVEDTMKDYKASEEDIEASLMSIPSYLATKSVAEGEPKAKVQHILISTTDDNMQPFSEEKKAEAKKKAEEILAMVKKDASDFVALVAEYSEDPGKVQNNGVYEFGKADSFVEEFKEAGFRLKDGETEIVESQFGYHIINKISEVAPKESEIAVAKDTIEKMKEQSVQMLRYQSFDNDYKNDILSKYTVELNEKVWNEIKAEYEKGLEKKQ